jgi:hypothetical protein
MTLTGRFNFRRSFGGKIVLQVEEEVRSLWPSARRKAFKKRWRDANLMDLAAPELRALIDLRYKPQYMAQYEHAGPDQAQPQPVAEVDESAIYEGVSLPRARTPLLGAERRIRAVNDLPPDTSVEVNRTDTRISRAQ